MRGAAIEVAEADLVYTATGISIDTSHMQEHFADRVNDRGQVEVDEFLRDDVIGYRPHRC